MTINLLQTPEYQKLMEEHISRTITYLFEKNQDFAIACSVKDVSFTPELPNEIKDEFKETVLFIIKGFTFESAVVEKDKFIFEAGFGESNFGSTVQMPFLAIKQLFLGENPIILNLSKPSIKQNNQHTSMEALLNNPENKKLLKKRK